MRYTVGGPDFDESGPLLFRPTLRRRRSDLLRLAEAYSVTWREACDGAGLSHTSTNGAGLTSTTTPSITHVQFDEDETSFMVRLLGGQVVDDLQAVSDRLADCLGVERIGLERRKGRWIRVVLNPPDPLATSVARPEPLATVHDPLTFGQLESGRHLRRSLVESTHLVVQGTTGSGKSVFTYNLLGQLAGTPDVAVVGSDPSGLLLQPWAAHDTGAWLALGTDSLEMHALVLERLVATMDQRIAELPAGMDKVEISTDTPLILGVLEEFPGLLRAAQHHDDALSTRDKARKLVPRIKSSYGRLLAEGRKAGIRLLIIAQRADADILGGYERGQTRLRFSFSVDTPDAVKMLHPASATELLEDHTVADPGIALVTAPGIKVDRMKAPDDYPFSDYCTHVDRALAPEITSADVAVVA